MTRLAFHLAAERAAQRNFKSKLKSKSIKIKACLSNDYMYQCLINTIESLVTESIYKYR